MNRRATDVKKDSTRQSETNVATKENSLADAAMKGDEQDMSKRARPEQIDTGKRKSNKDRKRIMITGVNSLVGHSLF